MKREKSQKRISRRLFLAVLLFSLLVTTLSTVVQGYLAYQRSIRQLNVTLAQLEQSYLSSVTTSLWGFDRAQLKAQIEGIRQFPSINYVAIKSGKEVLVAAGAAVAGRSMERAIPLSYPHAGRRVELGILYLQASYEKVWQQLLVEIVHVFIAQAVTVFLTSLLVFFLFERLVTRHLSRIADYFATLGIGSLETPLLLQRQGTDDELQGVVRSINVMRESLLQSLQEIRATDKALHERNEELAFTEARLLHQVEEYNKSQDEVCELYQRLQALINASPEAIVAMDLVGNVTVWNPAAARIFGWSELEVLGLFNPTIPDDRHQEFWALHERVIHNEKVVGVEVQRRKKDGSLLAVSVSTALLQDPSGGINGVMVLYADITGRKQAELLLKQSEEHFRALIENSLDVISIFGGDGIIRYESPSVERIMGYAPAELVGENAFKRIHPEDLPRVAAMFDSLLKNAPHTVTLELRYLHKDGSWRLLEGIGQKLINYGGGAEIVGNFRDITERRQIEQELQQLNTELEQRVAERTVQLEAANQELESFSYSVSHDLRSPLVHIDGFSQILLEDFSDRLGSDGVNYLQRIRTGTKRMGQLISDLLELSRVSRGEIRRQQVNLSKIAHLILQELQTAAPNRLTTSLVPPDVMAHGDVRLLRVVLENLFGNAWKYSSKQERAVIEFGVTEVAGETAYYVRDNGVGFDMAYAGKLFGAFQRLHGISEFEGTGIGLATVQRIIRRHGGRVWAEGAVGRGATFYFTLGPRSAGGAGYTADLGAL